MLVNPLAVPNVDPTSWTGTGGTGPQTRQRIRLTVDTGPGQPPAPCRVDRATGRRGPVPLRGNGSGTATFAIEIDGGQGDLFLWH